MAKIITWPSKFHWNLSLNFGLELLFLLTVAKVSLNQYFTIEVIIRNFKFFIYLYIYFASKIKPNYYFQLQFSVSTSYYTAHMMFDVFL